MGREPSKLEESSSSDTDDGNVAAFEARMATWEGQHANEGCDEEVTFNYGGLPGSAALQLREAREKHARIGSFIAERWAEDDCERQTLDAMAKAIEDEATKLSDDALDEFGELAKRPSLIERHGKPGRLLVGSEEDACTPATLVDFGIRAILNCTEDKPSKRLSGLYKKHGISFLHVAMDDAPDDDLATAASR